MVDPRTGLVASVRRALRLDRAPDGSQGGSRDAAAPAAGAPGGVPTPEQLAAERTGADPVWDC